MRNLIKEYLKRPTSFTTENLFMEITSCFFKRSKTFLPFYFGFEDVRFYHDKKGRLKSDQLEGLADIACTLLCTKKRRWRKFTEKMTAIEYIDKENMGAVEKSKFSKLSVNIDALFENLIKKGYLDKEGIIQDKFRQLKEYSNMSLDSAYESLKKQIYTILRYAYAKPTYFLFDQHKAAARTLLEEYHKEDPMIKELLKIRDNVGKKLKKYFKEIPPLVYKDRPKYGLWEWGEEKYKNTIDPKELKNIHIAPDIWEKLTYRKGNQNQRTYRKGIQLILEEADHPLTSIQVATTFQRLSNLLVKEEQYPLLPNEKGKEIDFIDTVEADGEIHRQPSLNGRESCDLNTMKQQFSALMQGKFSPEEIALLKLKVSKESGKLSDREAVEQMKPYFGKIVSDEKIRLLWNDVIKRMKKEFSSFDEDFIYFLAKFFKRG